MIHLLIFVFITGALMGSFFNALIYRIPLDMPISKGRSICPKCGHTLAARDLIPVFSYLFLKGRCRYCQEPVSIRYPLIEILTAFVYAGTYLYFKDLLLTGIYCSFFSELIISAILDIDKMIISTNVLIISSFISLIFLIARYRNFSALFPHFIGSAAGGAAYFAVYFISKLVYKKEAFGAGDVELLAAAGFILKLRDVLIVAVFSFFVALFFVGVLRLFGSKFKFGQEIPFGPYVCLTSVLVVFFGDYFYRLYSILRG
jgi:leader peptidase (prepilin peptidase)/N-methyltransferase